MPRPPRSRTELHGLAAELPTGATVEVGGGPVLSMQTRAAVQDDLTRAEFTSLPLTLIVLVLVFGGVVAAGLPVLTAAVSVAVAMGVLLGFTTFTDVDQDGVTVVTLLGLGLAVDYGLLLVARYREELRAGHQWEAAVARAWATAGRTVLFSALTVAAALSGLLMFRVPTLTALGAAGVSIAVVCMLASLTFTAALVGLLRRWIKPSRRARRTDADEAEVGVFARISRAVQRRPLVVALGTMALLLVAGAPLFATELRLPGLEGIPRSIESARVADTLSARFARPADTGDHRRSADRPGDTGRLGREVDRRGSDIPGTAGASPGRQRQCRCGSNVDGRLGRDRRPAECRPCGTSSTACAPTDRRVASPG